MLHRPLHVTTYFLNPRCFYSENFSNDVQVRRGLRECMQHMIPDIREYAQADVELDSYKQRLEKFGTQLAQMTLKTCSPSKIQRISMMLCLVMSFFNFLTLKSLLAAWWERFGHFKSLQFGFSLTTSASGCERNWSTFEQVRKVKS